MESYNAFPEVWAVGDADFCPPDHDCLTWFPDHVDCGFHLTGKWGGRFPTFLYLTDRESYRLLPAPYYPLSHRRPGILVLINDADWELLVSTSSDTPPQPLPSLLQWETLGFCQGWVISVSFMPPPTPRQAVPVFCLK